MNSLNVIAGELNDLLLVYFPQLEALTTEQTGFKPLPDKWSKKEILGHLVDSAQNNARRFIISQYEENPLIVYRQNEWVSINNYLNYVWRDLVLFWYLANRQVICILNNTSAEAAQYTCLTPDLHTIEWLAADYIKHLKHHLHQVLTLDPFPYP